jgi:uncharacterized membrane protein
MKKAIQWTRGERIVRLCVFGAVLGLALLTLWFSLVEGRGWPELNTGSDLVLPLAQLKTNKLFLFRYHVDASAVASVAVQRGPDGIIRAALASCRSCSKSRNFERSGNLVCGHCRHVMKMPDPTTEPDGKKPGCALPSLAYSIVDDRFLLRGEMIRAEFLRQFRPGSKGQLNQ